MYGAAGSIIMRRRKRELWKIKKYIMKMLWPK
jgi:hypothetical protein